MTEKEMEDYLIEYRKKSSMEEIPTEVLKVKREKMMRIKNEKSTIKLSDLLICLHVLGFRDYKVFKEKPTKYVLQKLGYDRIFFDDGQKEWIGFNGDIVTKSIRKIAREKFIH